MTGAPRPAPVPLVDFVPVGYDLDLLEVRLLELYDVVDLFVLYESRVTQQGVPKPLYLSDSMSRDASRWARFVDKMLVLTSDVGELQAEIERARSGQWDLERNMRTRPVVMFRTSQDGRVVRLRGQGDTLAIQNDGDEMMSASAAYHIKMCEPKMAPPYYVPCTGYKLNAEWAQHTIDRQELGILWASEGLLPSGELGGYLMAPGPVVQSLSRALETGALDRWYLTAAAPQLGPGAAVHLSSPSEPVGTWLKATGAVESRDRFAAVDPRVLEAARNRSASARHVGDGARGMVCVMMWCV